MKSGDSLFTLGDKISIINADQVLHQLSALLDSSECSRLFLDMSNVRILDSQGIRVLLNLQRKASQNGKALFLYRPDRILRETFEHIKLTHVFTIVDSVELE